jgi:glyoxylase-like metal-dependent hydrolase (beta-lactamase superfamily II)
MMHIETIDLEFQGTPHAVAAFLVEGPAGVVLIETGPSTTLPTLLARMKERGIMPSDVRDVLLTHIHLDHAGAAGWWAQQGSRIHVHPLGAPHVVDPARLLSSATRIYGDQMETLWGDVLPAPADRVVEVKDGEVIEVAGLEITAVDTPGHAWHHHVFRIDDVAFAGDVAGIMLMGKRWIDVPAPPPEFDLEQWRKSIARLRGLGLGTLYRTHFGASSDVDVELARFEEVLLQGSTWIREMMEHGFERERMIEEFEARMRDWATRTGTGEEDARAYEVANPRYMSVDGIARYWRKKSVA